MSLLWTLSRRYATQVHDLREGEYRISPIQRALAAAMYLYGVAKGLPAGADSSAAT
jgi:hypothetical protein